MKAFELLRNDVLRAVGAAKLADLMPGYADEGLSILSPRDMAWLKPQAVQSARLDTLAGVLEDLGQCGDALAVQRRAVDVIPERMTDKGRRPYLERLGRLEAHCGARPAASPPSGAPVPSPAGP